LASDCIDMTKFIRTEVFVVILNLSVGIVIRVIDVFVVKDDALFMCLSINVVQVDGQLIE
jgi:hypothetical protein